MKRVAVGKVIKFSSNEYLMFHICFRDIDTANICYSVSEDGLKWKNDNKKNPIIVPSQDGWDKDACYRPTATFNKEQKNWLLWYNGRRRHDEFIGLATCDNEFFWK